MVLSNYQPWYLRAVVFECFANMSSPIDDCEVREESLRRVKFSKLTLNQACSTMPECSNW